MFDNVQIENVVAGLRFNPEKIVFVGFKEIMTKKKMRILSEFFGTGIKLEFVVVGRYDFDAIYEKLNFILDNNEDCCFDLTGGKELVITAMGAVSAVRNVPMFQIDVRSGRFIPVKGCRDMEETENPSLTLEEMVKLNGCSVIHGDAEDYVWNLTEDFKKDIETVWDICKKNCALWNYQSKVLGGFEKHKTSEDNLCVNVNLKTLSEAKIDVTLSPKIIEPLRKNYLIADFKQEGDFLSFKYKNEQVKNCIVKSGNILELYSYMLMTEIASEEKGYYDDVDIGVYIDWDGIVHPLGDDVKETKNEVDIMVMRDLVPIFISCKNGEVRKEALYELSVVAQKFGGIYAKKFLLATYVNNNQEAYRCIKQRALDMGITLIDGIHFKTREEFKAILKKKIK